MPDFSAATSDQIRFIEALLTERDTARLDAVTTRRIDLHRQRILNRRGASALIDTLTALPRLGATATVTSTSTASTEQIPTPSFKTRAGRMLQAGGIEATVTMPNGQHVTIRVSSRAPRGRGWANVGPTDEGARINISVLGRKVGWVNIDENGAWNVTFRTRNIGIKDAVRVMFSYAAGNVDETGNMGAYRVQESSRCGRCFRQLTDPVSIDRGIGPECYGRTTGSHHVRVEANTTAAPEPRESGHPAGLLNAASRRDSQQPAATAPTATATFRAETIEQARAFAEASNAVQQAASRAASSMVNVQARTTAAPADTPVDDEIQQARDLIVEALDAYEGGVTAGMNALAVFDKLARRAAATS